MSIMITGLGVIRYFVTMRRMGKQRDMSVKTGRAGIGEGGRTE